MILASSCGTDFSLFLFLLTENHPPFSVIILVLFRCDILLIIDTQQALDVRFTRLAHREALILKALFDAGEVSS